jgi:hypothetical protein
MRRDFANLVSVVVVCLVLAFSGKPAEAQQNCFVVAASRETFVAARAFALSLDPALSAEIRLASNGYYAVTVGLIEREKSNTQVDMLIRNEKIPADAFCSSSGNYGNAQPYIKENIGWLEKAQTIISKQKFWLKMFGLLVVGSAVWIIIRRRNTPSKHTELRSSGFSMFTPRKVGASRTTAPQRNVRTKLDSGHKHRVRRKPQAFGILPIICAGVFSLLILWISDHALIVDDDIHWVFMILCVALPLAIGPLWFVLSHRSKGRADGMKYPTGLLYLDGFTLIISGVIAPLILVFNSIDHSSSLSPDAHSAALRDTFQSVEIRLATDYPKLFGPDANDIRRADEAIARAARDRAMQIAVAEERAAKKAKQDLAILTMQEAYVSANKYWPAIARDVEHFSSCNPAYRRGGQMNLDLLELEKSIAQKYVDCTLNYATRNAAQFVNDYNSKVSEYAIAVREVTSATAAPKLSYVKTEHFMEMVRQSITRPYEKKWRAYMYANIDLAASNTKAKQKADNDRRKFWNQLAARSQELNRIQQQQLQNTMSGYIRPSNNFTQLGQNSTVFSSGQRTSSSNLGVGTPLSSADMSGTSSNVKTKYRYTSCKLNENATNLSTALDCNIAQSKNNPNTVFIDDCTIDVSKCKGGSFERLTKVQDIPPQGTVVLPALSGYSD